MCRSYLNDKILKGFDNGLFTVMILIDLQKAFDTIDHNILLEKSKAIGFCENTVNWFLSYLTDWVFLVSIENKYQASQKFRVVCLKDQFLALCFFIYIFHGMKQAVSSNLLLCADDSCLISVTYVNGFLIIN